MIHAFTDIDFSRCKTKWFPNAVFLALGQWYTLFRWIRFEDVLKPVEDQKSLSVTVSIRKNTRISDVLIQI